MNDALGGSSNEYSGKDCTPVTTRLRKYCGFQQPMQCPNQGEPLSHDGFVSYTLYPCNAPKRGNQQPLQAAQPAAGGGLELKLAERSV